MSRPGGRDQPPPRTILSFSTTRRARREDQRESVVGHAPVVCALGGGDEDAKLGGGRDVDLVEADAPARDVLEGVGPFEDGAVVGLG